MRSPRLLRPLVALLGLASALVVGTSVPAPVAAAEGWRVTFTSSFSGTLPGVGAVAGRISGDIPLVARDDATDLVASQAADVLMDYESYSGPSPAGCTFAGVKDGYSDGITVYDPKAPETRFDVLMGLYGGGFPPTGEFLIGAERHTCPEGTAHTRHGAQMWACIGGGVVPASQGRRGPYYYPLAPGETRTFTGSVPDTGVCPGATGTHTTTITLHSPPLAAPSVPREVRAGVGDTPIGPVITVSWAPPTSTGGSPIGAYVLRLLDGGTVVQTRVIDGGQRAGVFTDQLLYGHRYSVRVSARNGSFVEGPQSPAVGPLVPIPFDDTITFVTRTFQDLVGRSPTASERAGWAGPIDAHTRTPGDLVAALRSGADGTTNVDPVVRLYRAYFLRDPDPGGLDYWVAQRRAGKSLAWASNAFVATPEFRTRYASATTPEAFVRLVYENVLGRAPDAAGLAYWSGEISSGRKTRGAVMIGFSESAENKARLRPHVQMLVQHLALLDRRPTDREADAGRELVITAGLAGLAHHIIGLEEYADRVR